MSKCAKTIRGGKSLKRLTAFIMTSVIVFLIGGCSGKTEQLSDNSPVPYGGTAVSAVPDNRPWPVESWSESTPEAQGISSSELEKSDGYIRENYKSVSSLLVIRHGYLVYEKYYNGTEENTSEQVYSVTKSVMSALTGIALQQKLIESVDQSVAELVPDYFTEIDDTRKKNITVKEVLTMTGGLQSIDNDYNGYFSSPDWLSQTLKMPLSDDPGTKFVYNTGLTQFLSNIITSQSGMNTENFAQKYLFSEIGIQIGGWQQDQKGFYGGGYGISMTPGDMARFGYLYLNNGQWNGKQILPESWIEESSKKQIQADNDTDYGYLFWLQTVHDSIKNVDYFTYRADGAGGQKIIIIPKLDMVAVITADWDSNSKDDDTQNIIFNYVIPAVN